MINNLQLELVTGWLHISVTGKKLWLVIVMLHIPYIYISVVYM